jgi:hypothetical protein
MKNYMKKVLCVFLSAVMVFSLASCSLSKKDTTDTSSDSSSDTTQAVKQVSYDTAAKSYKKNETVYVNTDAQGNVSSEVVTDWLHTDTAETYIDDTSNLKDIKNVKSNVEPVIGKDGAIRWNMETTDLYYRGTTDKELPVNFNITYYLDGKEMDAKDIAGKSGQVKMVITVNNESKKEVTINGEKTTIYTPFIVAGGMILEESSFQNVTVENGKSIGDGTKEIALLVGAPGLKESLKLDDDLLAKLGDFKFSNTYTITADTQNFEISNMMFAVIPLSAIETEINSTLPKTVSDVKETLTKVQAIIDKFNSMNASDLMNKLFTNTDKLTDLTKSISEATDLYNNNKALINVIEKYMTEDNIKAIQSFINDTNSIDLQGVVEILSNPILQKFFKQLPTIAGDMQNVMPILNGLSKDMSDPAVQKAINNLPQTLATIKELKKTLDDNQELFNSLSKTLDADTIASIKDIMNSLDSMISDNMIEQYLGLADDADTLIARAKEWVAAGKEYNIFTTSNDTAQTSVMFVYETAPITAPVVKTNDENASTEAENPIKAWFENLFKKNK